MKVPTITFYWSDDVMERLRDRLKARNQEADRRLSICWMIANLMVLGATIAPHFIK